MVYISIVLDTKSNKILIKKKKKSDFDFITNMSTVLTVEKQYDITLIE